MLDIEFIRTNRTTMEQALADKGMSIDLDHLLEIDEERRTLIAKRDALLNERNNLSIDQAKVRGPQIKEELSPIEARVAAVQVEFDAIMLTVPQIPAADSPRGAAENAVEVKQVGTVPTFDFPVRDHIDLGESLDLIDTNRGATVGGYRGYYLKNEAALMHHGLMQLAMHTMRARGFTVMVPPTIVREFALTGSGHFPFGKEEIYQIGNPGRLADGSEQKEPAYLVGTAEPSLLAYYADQMIDLSEPVKLCGISQCYRSEVGGYGRDTRGLYRVHEFMKTEQVIICEANDELQQQMFNQMLSVVEELLQKLELPYRVIDTSTEDMGAGKVRMYDIETWMPSRNSYGETHSCSMLGDWQARRLNIKYKDSNGKKRYAYTLNNTVLASPRLLIALLENHQQPDGSVRIPEALAKFVGVNTIQTK